MSTVISSVAGTRSEPKDSYLFVRNTTATFKITLVSNGVPTIVDTATVPFIRILQPLFLNNTQALVPTIITTINGALVAGQEYEYQFIWNIPLATTPNDEYVIQYYGTLGGIELNFGDEFFTVSASPGMVDIFTPYYATPDDIRMHKFNIDDYLPKIYAKDLTARNNLISRHIRNAGIRLREELVMFKVRGNSENYRLFCIWYTIWSLMLAARGEDGSSVSSENLATYHNEWGRILRQEKAEGGFQSIQVGRN